MLVPRENGRIWYDEKVDIWCLGILLYHFLFGMSPFMTLPFNKDDTFKLIKKIKYRFPVPKDNSEYQLVIDLIKKILVVPNERLTLDQILSHPWIKNSTK
jgi:serine/threonine protein kinase